MTIPELRNRGDRTHVKDEGSPDNPLGKIPRHERKEGGINNTKKKGLPSRYSPPGCSFTAVPLCLTGED